MDGRDIKRCSEYRSEKKPGMILAYIQVQSASVYFSSSSSSSSSSSGYKVRPINDLFGLHDYIRLVSSLTVVQG